MLVFAHIEELLQLLLEYVTGFWVQSDEKFEQKNVAEREKKKESNHAFLPQMWNYEISIFYL